MQNQWQPTFSVDGYTGPTFRRGRYVACGHHDETTICWHLFRARANESLERLWCAEEVQAWNAAESVEFPRQWADETLAQHGWIDSVP